MTRSGLILKLGESPETIEGLFHQALGANICSKGLMRCLIRTPDSVSDPAVLLATAVETDAETTTVRFQDSSGDYQARLTADPSGSGIQFRALFEAPKPIWLAEWVLQGLDLESVIVPALGGQAITNDMPEGTTLSYKYPFWWNAQFVLGTISESGGMILRTEDAEPNLKLFRVSKNHDRFTFSLGFEAPAPLNARKLEAEWFLEGYEGTWQTGVDLHRRWLDAAFQLEPLAAKSYVPEWLENISFILEIWGARKDAVRPPHTFEEMIQRLKEWRELHDPARTLVYLPGFAEHGIDSHAPDYNPSDELGGSEKFRQLMDSAHEMGYKVMIHTNVLALTYSHPQYDKYKQYQVIDAFDRPQGWGLDIDGDWLAEPYFAYMNPGYKEWGNLMEQILGQLIRDFRIDGVFLDQTLLAFNVSRGPNFIAGMHTHIQRLQEAFPQVLFGGEGVHEHVIGPLPMVQIHGIDSLADIHGMEGQVPWRKPHPVSTYLFGPYARITAHLLTKHPSHPIFSFQEKSYRELGIIPALCLYDHSQAMDLPEVREMIRRAKTMFQEGRD